MVAIQYKNPNEINIKDCQDNAINQIVNFVDSKMEAGDSLILDIKGLILHYQIRIYKDLDFVRGKNGADNQYNLVMAELFYCVIGPCGSRAHLLDSSKDVCVNDIEFENVISRFFQKIGDRDD